MWKKCTLLWREAHFEVKMLKTAGTRTTFGGSDVASRGRCKGFCLVKSEQNVGGLKHFQVQPPLHHTTLQYMTIHYNYKLQLHLHYILLHYTPLHHTALNYTITLHYTTLHYTTLHYTTLHYTTFHYNPQHYNYNYTTTLHYTPLHCTTRHYLPLHYTTYTTLHYITLHYTT